MRVLPPDDQGSRMPASAPKNSYFPQPRAELAEKLVEADQILDASMAGTEQTIPAGLVLVREGESHQSVYRLVRGKMVRVRSLEDGRRQIICIGKIRGVNAASECGVYAGRSLGCEINDARQAAR